MLQEFSPARVRPGEVWSEIRMMKVHHYVMERERAWNALRDGKQSEEVQFLAVSQRSRTIRDPRLSPANPETKPGSNETLPVWETFSGRGPQTR
jgi:hypothetical protein